MIPDIHRRAFLQGSTGFLGSLALGSLAGNLPGSLDADTRQQKPHFRPRAKRVIFLCQLGAPSQLDLFDPKPKLLEMDGQPMPESLVKGQAVDQLKGRKLVIAGSHFRFRKHGRCGMDVSELLPNISSVTDEIALVRSMYTDVINHAPAQVALQTGFSQDGRPSIGAWTAYGLGSGNENLPTFAVLASGGRGQPNSKLWSNGFLPGEHQGVRLLSGKEPVPFLQNPDGVDRSNRRAQLDAIHQLNAMRATDVGDPAIRTKMEAYELAYRMQASVPELADLASESKETLALYGAAPGVPSYATNCLLARRLAERGVRFIQLYHSDWDHHYQLPRLIRKRAEEVDRASAALIIDLKRRGLLEDTLVVWGGEFGRTPMNQGGQRENYGRDHHGKCFSMWLAGGGVKGGTMVGKTDEFGYDVVDRPVHINDLQATILHQLGLDHERLTYRHQGRDYRLTDVRGRVVSELLT